jgi:site-specific DNA-adenine methylase
MGNNYKGQRMISKAQDISTSWAYKMQKINKKDSLVLLDNVQFIYELALAQLELQAFNVDYQVLNGLREFKLLKDINLEPVIKKSAYFKYINGEVTDYFKIIKNNVTRSVNQYLTHWIYPYKGKFHPQMIRALLNIIGLKESDKVLDPFIGSGTTAIECKLLGISCIGIDISPLCVLQSSVKTESIDIIDKIIELKNDLINGVKQNLFNQGGKAFFEILKSVEDEKVRNFYKMAYLVAVSDNARRGKNIEKSFSKNLELMITSVKGFKDVSDELRIKLGETNILLGDSRKLPLENESVDGIITSPPYSIALDYVSNDAHALEELGYDILSWFSVNWTFRF